MALTEPDASTNTLAMKSYAEAEPAGGWRLNGRKIWITAVDAAQKMLVVARTSRQAEGRGPATAYRCSSSTSSAKG